MILSNLGVGKELCVEVTGLPLLTNVYHSTLIFFALNDVLRAIDYYLEYSAILARVALNR